jgi:hypothetical protein
MKNKIVLFSVLAVFALFAVIAVPSVSATYPANAIYLNPEDSIGWYCENNTLVEVRVNANVVTTSVQTDIYFDPSCVNITDVDYTGSAWPPFAPPGWTHFGDHVTLIGMNFAGAPAGDNLFATIRLHCVKEEYCPSDLEFRGVIVTDSTYTPIDTTAYDGTVTCVPPGEPDLNVTAINVNADIPNLCGLPFGPVPHAGARTQCNSISTEIEEDNGVATGAFDVCFYVDDVLKCKVPVAGMAGGDKKTVWCNCSWYPLAGPHTINVTVDCQDVIAESDETNNTLLKDVTAVQHGLKGNSWQDGRNITTLQCHPQDNISLTYSVGDSKKAGAGWTEYYSNWTQSDLSIPDGATIEKARLYAYYNWDKTPDGSVTDFFALTFNGVPIAPAAIYTDTKHPSRLCNGCTIGMCKYNYPYGMLAYDVTGEFNAIADNTAVLTNVYPGGMTAMTGMLLVVVYKHPGEPGRIIWINEGFDRLYAGNSYGVSSDEATTYAPFEGCVPIPMDEVKKATLVTITNHAGDIPGSDKNRLYFNTVLLGDGLWSPYMGLTEIGANEANVLALLDPTDNTAAYQSNIPAGGTSGDWMEASNAFLILEKPPVEKPDLVIEKSVTIEDGNFTVYYTVKNIGNGPAGASNTTIYIDSVNVLEDPVPALASGDSFTNTVGPFDCPCDTTLNVTVCADNGNVVAESDETNNCEINEVPCPPCMPDLVITDIWAEDNKIHYTIKNVGGAAAGVSDSGLYIDGRYLARDRVDGLASGESSTESFGRYGYTPGDTVKVCADYQGRIEESDETNNCREWKFEEGPDLVIEDKWEEWVNATHYTTRIHSQLPLSSRETPTP